PGQIDRSLAGRVAAADDVDRTAVGGGCLAERGAVEHADTEQLLDARRAQPPVLHADADHYYVAGHLAAAGQRDDLLATSSAEAGHTVEDHFGAELHRV